VVVINVVGATDENLLAAIIELGDGNRKTLGFLPQAVFRKASETGTSWPP
jgi:hypothetical protein